MANVKSNNNDLTMYGEEMTEICKDFLLKIDKFFTFYKKSSSFDAQSGRFLIFGGVAVPSNPLPPRVRGFPLRVAAVM